MAELKPCPFCGGEAAIKEQSMYIYNAIFAHCKNCKARVMESFHDAPNIDGVTLGREKATEKAIEAWNRRCEDAELTFTRQFIHEQGLEYALASAWERRCKDGTAKGEKMRFYKNGELKDREIVAALRKAANDYENGEITEVRDLLADIVDAIDEWEDAEDGK